MFKFIHAADIHLDSPLKGLEQYEGAPLEKIRLSTRRAFDNLLELALQERVAFVVIAGDLYDGDWRDYNTGLYFAKGMARLRQAGITAFLIAGNHDAANRMTRCLNLPENVTMLSAEEPETRVLEDLGVAIHGQGFAAAEVKQDLSARYPPPRRGCFNLGLLHTCLDGREGHERYAPCALEGLLAKEYDYWALGHVHHRETVLSEPIVAFPGNLQGRHIRETGPKGCLLVTVSERNVEATFCALDVVRWELCEVDAGACATADAVLERAAEELAALKAKSDGRLLVARVEVRGRTPAHAELVTQCERWTSEVRARALELGPDEIWIEKVKFRTTPSAARQVDAGGPLGELLAVVEEARSNAERLLELAELLKELDRKLPSELKREPDCLRLSDPAWLRGMLDRAGTAVVSRLLEEDRA